MQRKRRRQKVLQVIKRLTAIDEFSTVEYTIHKVIRLSPQTIHGKVLSNSFQRKMIYDCKAILKAGFDLKAFNSSNIEIDHESNALTIHLPEAKQISLDIPIEGINSVYEHTGFFRRKLNPQEKQHIQIEGQKQIKENIKELKLLDDAKNNMHDICTSILLVLGFDSVNVLFDKNN